MIYLDSSIIIRLIEGIDAVRTPIASRLQQIPETDRILITSRLSCLECQCKPIREKRGTLLALYREFFASGAITLYELTVDVVERATIVRAETGFKTPDALHASTAILAKADRFWTTDANFRKCSDLPLEIFPSV